MLIPSWTKYFNSMLLPFDLKISRASTSTRWQMSSLISRLRRSPVEFQSVIDVGAASGSWTQMVNREFPGCHFLAIEPIHESFQVLRNKTRHLKNVNLCQSLVGKSDGDEVSFTLANNLDGSGVGLPGHSTQKYKVRSLDSIVNEHQMIGPYLLKLDTHGFEIPILDGASGILGQCAALIIEAYNYEISPYSVYFWELCKIMHEKGFRPADIADPSPRRLDQSFWQLDILFLPINSPCFSSSKYE
jgi:FkbM family methyltransferase